MVPSRPGWATHWPILGLARMEWRIGWRTAAFRAVAVGAFALGWATGGTAGRGVGLSAYATAEVAWQYLGFVAIVWMSLAAVRETGFRTAILIFSKPQPGERMALAKFLGALLQVLAFLLAMFAGSSISRLFTGGWLGVEAYGIQYARAAGVLFFASAASFSLALLSDSALAGALVGLYWILTLAGKAYLGKFYFPAYTQNQSAYLMLGLGLLLLTLNLYGRARRGAAVPALWVRLGAPACLLLAGGLFWTIVRDGHDPHTRLNPVMELMREQDTAFGLRTAGFSLPDQTGKLVGLSDFPEKVLVIALWSPQDPDSVLLLDRLDALQAQRGPQGVRVVAIAISEDNGAAATFARGEGVQYPMVADWGTSSVPDRSESSPLANAYRASALPMVVVTDRRRRVRQMLNGTMSYDGTELDLAVAARLADEPR